MSQIISDSQIEAWLRIKAERDSMRGELKEVERNLFEARRALFSQGNYLIEIEKRMNIAIDEIAKTKIEFLAQSLILGGSRKQIMFMRQKIECALTCHPNAVKYLLEEAIGIHDEV